MGPAALLDKLTFAVAMPWLVAWMVAHGSVGEELIHRLDKVALRQHAGRGLVRTMSVALAFASLFATAETWVPLFGLLAPYCAMFAFPPAAYYVRLLFVAEYGNPGVPPPEDSRDRYGVW